MTLVNPFMSFPAAGGGSFDPISDVSWDHAYWTEGSAFASQGYSDTDSVTTFPDEVGSSNATEATNPPVYDASNASYGGNPVVTASTTTQLLRTASFPSALTQTHVTVVIGNFATTASGTHLFDNEAGAGECNLGTRSGVHRMNAGNVYQGSISANTNPRLYVCTYAGASSVLEIDGTAESSGDAGTNSRTGLSLFQSRSGGDGSGSIAFVGVKSGALTSGEKADLETWANDHYGITIA